MRSTPALVFSGLCVVAGTVTYCVTGEQGFAMVLLGMSGASGVGAGAVAKREETKQREIARAEQRRADHWQEQTQAILMHRDR